MLRILEGLVAASLVLPVVSCTTSREGAGGPPVSEEAYVHNNLGIAQLEEQWFDKAAEEFTRVIELAPERIEGYVNLGIAKLYLHEGDLAVEAFDLALAKDPDEPRALFGKAVAYKNRGENRTAIDLLLLLLDEHGDDPKVLGNLGVLYFRLEEFGPAADHLKASLAVAPQEAANHFRLSRVLQREGDEEGAKAAMESFQALRTDPTFAQVDEFKYPEMGKLTEAMPLLESGAAVAERSRAISFQVASEEAGLEWSHPGPGTASLAGAERTPSDAGAWLGVDDLGSGAAWGDLDGDGDFDLVVASGGKDGTAAVLFRNSGDGTFLPGTPLGRTAPGTIAMGTSLGDIENDGDLDVYVTTSGRNLMLRNDGGGTFVDIAEASGTDSPYLSMGSSFGDLDHDGDADLVVTNFAPAEAAVGNGAPDFVFRNNGDGTFTEIGKEIGVLAEDRSTGILFTDFDNDRDVDFIITRIDGPPRLYSNLRVGTFRDIAPDMGLGSVRGAWCATGADFDRDTGIDLVFATGRRGAGPLFRNLGQDGFEAAPLGAEQAEAGEGPAATSILVFDHDNDGRPDLLIGFDGEDGRASLRLYRNLDGTRFDEVTRPVGLHGLDVSGLRGMAAADYDQDGDLDLVVVRNGGPLLLLQNVGGSAEHWLRVRPVGSRSNHAGLGLKAEVKAGGMWQKYELRGSSGYLSQSSPQVHFGLGPRAKAEGVTLLWPSGNLQTLIEVSSNQTVEMQEPSSKGSSCPHLFAWDGRHFRFVNDFLGTGGLGFRVGESEFGIPDPDELLKIGRSAPKQGRIELRAVNQLEEIIYFDGLELVAVDHPNESEIFPEERFAVEPPFPSFGLLVVRERIHPRAAQTEAGRDCLEKILAPDRETVDDFEMLTLPGYAVPHALTLDFRGTAQVDDPVLFLHGWVDYETSSSNRAAAQRGIALRPPRLSVSREGKRWRTVAEVMGFPAGLSRTMVYDLSGELEPGERIFRIETNMRIYWDEAFLAPRDAGSSELVVSKPALLEADLRFLGFPREFSPDGRRPLIYDYTLADRFTRWRLPFGFFTRYGRVEELVRQADDRFAILAPGDEIALAYDARSLPELPEGWKRTYFLYATGYGKDMDPNTAYAGAVAPLPFADMSAYPYGAEESYPLDPAHLEYLRTWNTRGVGIE